MIAAAALRPRGQLPASDSVRPKHPMLVPAASPGQQPLPLLRGAAEFDDRTDAVKALTVTAAKEPAQFVHVYLAATAR